MVRWGRPEECPDKFAALIADKTRAVHLEIIGDPALNMAAFGGVAVAVGNFAWGYGRNPLLTEPNFSSTA